MSSCSSTRPSFFAASSAALSHDLGHARAVLEREALDDNLIDIGDAAPLEDRQPSRVGLGDEQFPARAAALERADDGVPIELAGALRRLVGTRSRGHGVRNAHLDALGQAREQQEASRVTDADAVHRAGSGREFGTECASVVIGVGPACDDDVEHDQQRQSDRREDRPDDSKDITDFAGDETVKVSDDQTDPAKEHLEELDREEDQEHAQDGGHDAADDQDQDAS
ncbi:MAG: hypothetical protein ACFHWZ_01500 [Phycisphaerales bacterium]